MSKHKEGRDEVVLDPDLAIIDSHHHLFVRPQLHYLLDDYLEDVHAGHKLVASVYVETQYEAYATGPELLRPLGEIAFADRMGALADSGHGGGCRVAAAVVGHADLGAGDAVAELLDQALALAPERLRGFRQMAMAHSDARALRFLGQPPPSDLLTRPAFHAGLKHLARRGLSFDATVFHHQLAELGAIAQAHPDLTIVLNHLGLALAMDLPEVERDHTYRAWGLAIRELARQPNVVCKVGGLGTAYWGFGFNERPGPATYLELASAWRPFVETAIEAFGPARCMMESDFPADGRSCGFVPLWNALKHITRACSAQDKAALFHGTAARVYRIAI